MKKSQTIAVVAAAVTLGFCAGLLFNSASIPALAQTKGAPTPTRANAKEPVASPDEFKSHVVHYPDVPYVELVKGSNSKLITGEQSMLSFLKMDAHSYFAPHKHPQEQIMTVLEGECDEIIEGKIYHVKKGDVIILPPNIEHGAYIGNVDCYVLDVFGYPRSDYLLKVANTMAAMAKK